MIIYVSADDVYCGGNTLGMYIYTVLGYVLSCIDFGALFALKFATILIAWAEPCIVDSYGRTIAGAINFCPSSLSQQD